LARRRIGCRGLRWGDASTITWTGKAARLLDQTKLPTRRFTWTSPTRNKCGDAIKRSSIRGAPAIGVAAAFGVYLGVRKSQGDRDQLLARFDDVCAYLATSRPTAVNLFWALDRMKRVARKHPTAGEIKAALLEEAVSMIEEDNRVCRAIGEHGAKLLRELLPITDQSIPIRLLTHCNAGGLATVQYGTALAPVYVGAEQG